jgi:hypothetical protein
MNRFLLGLVERATLRAAVLERRPRSLFEPTAPPVAGLGPIDGAEQTESDGIDPRTGPSRGSAPASLPHREPAADGGPAAGSTRIESSREAEAPPSLGRPAAPASSPAGSAGGEPQPVRSTTPRPDELEQGPRHEAALATAIPLPPPARGRGRLPTPARRPPQAQAASIEHAAGAAHAPLHGRGAWPASADPAITGPAPTPPGGPPATASMPVLSPGPRIPGPPPVLVRSQAGPGAQQPNGIAAAPPAPVHVTIGRVEVRAALPAVERSPVRRPPAGPRMTLDDYLHGRRGGSR